MSVSPCSSFCVFSISFCGLCKVLRPFQGKMLRGERGAKEMNPISCPRYRTWTADVVVSLFHPFPLLHLLLSAGGKFALLRSLSPSCLAGDSTEKNAEGKALALSFSFPINPTGEWRSIPALV